MGKRSPNPLNYPVRSRLTEDEGRKLENKLQVTGKTASEYIREVVVADLEKKED